MGDPEVTDPIDAAIAAVDLSKEPDSLQSELQWPDGRKARLIVPIEFGPDEFETCVGALLTLRVQSEQIKAAKANAGLAVPAKGIVALDGRKLT